MSRIPASEKHKAIGEKLGKKIAEKRAYLEAKGFIDSSKIPKYSLPSDYNVGPSPIFSLPMDIAKPILASSWPKYKKQLMMKKKKDKEQKAKMLSYTALRKNREEFRARLVKMLTEKDDEMEIDLNEIPSAEEREILRYYYYIRYGVDTVNVAPMDPMTIEKVMKLIPKKLRVWEDTLLAAIEDMKNDFMLSAKKAIVDFVLKDPCYQSSDLDAMTSSTIELLAFKGSFVQEFAAAKLKLERILYVVNPCFVGIIDLWYTQFRDFRIIDVNQLKNHEGAYELPDFQKLIKSQLESSSKILHEKYYGQIVEIFSSASKKGKLPSPALRVKFRKFYNAVEVLMTYQMRNLCLDSLRDYVEYLLDFKYANKGFIIDLLQRGDVLGFDPPFKNFREAMVKTIDEIVKLIASLNRLEQHLYVNEEEEPILLKVHKLLPLSMLIVVKYKPISVFKFLAIHPTNFNR